MDTETKGLKQIPYLRTENLKNHTLFRGTYLYSPYMGVPPPPPRAVPWNSLQIELWQADTLHSFKAAYTSQFLSYR